MTGKRQLASMILLHLFFVQSVKAQRNNFNEDYSAYIPEVKKWNYRLLHEGVPMPDSSAKTELKPAIKNIDGPGGALSLRIFKPPLIRAVVLDIHGGGWSSGIAAFGDKFNDEMARRCNVAVVSVEYRLAPDYSFPACINDCNAAAKWLINHACKEFNTDKIFIGGRSAGSHLAAVTTLYIRDSLHAIEKIKGVNLECGLYDFAGTPSLRLANDSTPFLTKETLDWTIGSLLPGWTTEQKQDPRYSPLYADLHNLPPAIFTIGTADPLLDDSFFMEARWRLAGNQTYLAVYPESPHAFNMFPLKMAEVAKTKIFQWIVENCE